MSGLNFFLKVSVIVWGWAGFAWLIYEAVKTT